MLLSAINLTIEDYRWPVVQPTPREKKATCQSEEL